MRPKAIDDELGLQIVARGDEPVTADIVFVHGLYGHQIGNWRLNDVFWPRDLLAKDLPNARMMSFGYKSSPSAFLNNLSNSSLLKLAIMFLSELGAKREATKEMKRPIIFIGHCLGDLIIKDALCKAYQNQLYGDNPAGATILESTKGLVFFGTPHRADIGNWDETITCVASTWPRQHGNDALAALKDGE